ncbi:MAG: tRNA (adenosine(37)-N6)-threonylcarbamoyltransferase complex ATPase subunit type 1 TsaE [Candidatus Peribacteraceae bacterium]|nr:tRNA (adenosine(37)-N6)-threonylcarbamoyltransferase complex ATPase subunit type 1 TsaE [Candidatus Peribacteraceae bacterium]
MYEKVQIWLPDAKKTRKCGFSLFNTIYKPVDILLKGEIGAGKTTFLHGFAEALGVNGAVRSPTFALENRHNTSKWGELLHIDLYRLDENKAKELYDQTEDHEGIRCIEWAERLKNIDIESIIIELDDRKDNNGRNLKIIFNDALLPSLEEIKSWRKKFELPENVCKHCDAVAEVCKEIGEQFIKEGYIIRINAIIKAALVHDLFRFVDFKAGASHDRDEIIQPKIWEEIKEEHPAQKHEEVCEKFLKKQGYRVLSEIVKTHGVRSLPYNPMTIEQKILFYADKRVILDKKVTLKERFDDFVTRYGDGIWTKHAEKWYEQAKEIEEELNKMK